MSGWLNDKNLNLNKRNNMQYTLEQCLEQQKRVDANIKHDGTYLPWLAGIGEVIEMCDHLSMISTWKKQPERDMKQAFMELVDVFAFVLSAKAGHLSINRIKISETLVFCAHHDLSIQGMVAWLIRGITSDDFSECVGYLIAICKLYFDRDPTDIYYYYMGKQTLTQFRQKNGYKTGGYIKMWHGREDNEYLTEYLEKGLSVEEIENALEVAYSAVVKGA